MNMHNLITQVFCVATFLIYTECDEQKHIMQWLPLHIWTFLYKQWKS